MRAPSLSIILSRGAGWDNRTPQRRRTPCHWTRLADYMWNSRAVLSALKGPALRPSACCPASHNSLAGLNGRRLSSQLSPGVQDEKSLGSVTEGDKLTAAGHNIVDFDRVRQREGVKEAVDVSGGIAGYKALFSDFGVSFYQQDGRSAGAIRRLL